MMSYLGPTAKYKLTEVGTAHWTSPNAGATNESGFTAVGGGERMSDGGFYWIKSFGIFWSSTQYPEIYNSVIRSWAIVLESVSDQFKTNAFEISYGFSVRCVKD